LSVEAVVVVAVVVVVACVVVSLQRWRIFDARQIHRDCSGLAAVAKRNNRRPAPNMFLDTTILTIR
jgi:hypothetical protein